MTLTKIAYWTRRGIIFSIAGLISVLVLKALFGLGIKKWQEAHPTPPPPPTVLFGKLPRIKFPKSEYSYPKDFILETVRGELPQTSPTAKVYQIPKKLPSLLASRRAAEFANRLGFSKEPVSKTQTQYKFEDPRNSLRTLELDIVNYNFTLKYDFLADPSVFKEKNLPSPDQAKIEGEHFFAQSGIFPPDLQKGERKVSFLKFSENNLFPTTSLSKADAVRVDFLRSKIDNLPLLSPEFERTSVFVIFSGSVKEEKRILLAEFKFFEVDFQNFATYPIKTPDKAWEELKMGRGFICRWLGKGEKAVIRKVYLAYLDLPEYQSFLQPIFVFEGDQDFVAYVPAIKDDWLE